MKTHGDLFDKHLLPDLDDQTALLKAHLLIEEMLRDFCYKSVRSPEHLRKARLNFTQVTKLARSLCAFDSAQLGHVWGMVKLVNDLRNFMAHELEPDVIKFETCRDSLIKSSGLKQTESDGSPVKRLAPSLSYLCGAMSAMLQVSLAIQFPDDFATD
jgi:hypothetical protein